MLTAYANDGALSPPVLVPNGIRFISSAKAITTVAQASNDTDLQYYLYMSEDWRGPYPIAQIRSFLKLGQIDETTYAYEPQHQSQLTVGDLLAGRQVMPQQMGTGAASEIGSSASREAVSAQPATARFSAKDSGRLDDAINAVNVMRAVCFTIREASGRERDDLLDDLKVSVDTIREVLERLRASPAELRNFAIQVDKIAADVAARYSDRALTAHLVDLRECITHADPDEIIPATDSVVAQIAHLARTADEENPFEIVDNEKTPDHGQPIDAYESARYELKSLQTDLTSVKDAYERLQEAYAKEQKQARKLLLGLKEQLEAEQKAHEGDNAELRALAAEIHDLGSACGLADIDPALAQDLGRLAEELQHTVPTTLVPVAEAVLNRMVNGLGSHHGQVQADLEELTTVRAELLQLKTDMSLLKQKEEQLQADKGKLQKQLEEERGAANRVDQSARAREAQLKSTIAALQVTKDLHQEVMGDLQEQLQAAQERVEDMERELLAARNELKGTKSTYAGREQELVQSLEDLSRERSDLEERQKNLSETLAKAEADLAAAKGRADQNEEDESLAEALAAKVNQLRDSFEATRGKLREQEANAKAMQGELEAARSEARELRGRSDQLSTELDSARGNLEAARKRMDELQRAAARLEAERAALQSELSERKGTDTILRSEAEGGHLQTIVAQLEAQVAESRARILDLEGQLDHERRRGEDLQRAHADSGSHHDDLAAERERLRGEIDALRDQGASGERIADLSERLEEAERQLRDISEARSDLQAKVVATAAERDRLNGELIRLRTEHEAAAVEHRAALAAARKAQAEAQTRAAELKAQLASAQAERERLADEVEAQRASIAENDDSESRLGALHQQLGLETQRADQLARDLDESRRKLAAASVKLERLEEEFADVDRERARLTEEITRKQDNSRIREAVDADGRNRLQEALDRLREQLEREQRRSADLEHRLESARAEARNAATRHADTAGSYADAVARADRFAGEMAELRSRHAAELSDAEQRLATERERARTLESRLAGIDAQVSAAAARRETLERSVADLTAERDRLAREGTSLREAKGEAEAKAADLGRRLREAEAELADLRSEAAHALESRQAVASELASTTGRHSRLAVTVDRLNRELGQARSELEARGTEHAAALQAVKERLEAERATIATLQDRLAEVERTRDEALARSTQLQARLDEADAARTQLIGEADALRAELAQTAHAVRSGAEIDPAEVAALRSRLVETEARLAAAKEEVETTAKRGADRLIDLERRLEAEHGRAADLDQLRERLRQEAADHAGAREALAQVTALRDRLQADRDHLQEEVRDLRRVSEDQADLRARLERSESHLAAERGKVARLEADLAIARSQQQVAAAGREGLEASLAKVVADRERLLGEVDRLRGELDDLRVDMRANGPVQKAEITALKQMLDLERSRVAQLEDRLAEAWRKQGETMALTDAELRRRLDRADDEIRSLRDELKEERRRSGTHHEDDRRRSDSAEPVGEASSGLRPSAAITPAPERAAANPHLEAGGFISAFGRSAVQAKTGSAPAAQVASPGFTSRFGPPAVPKIDAPQTTGVRRAIRQRRRWTTRAIGVGAAACLGVLAVGRFIVLPAMFPYCPVALVNAQVVAATAPITGEVSEILVRPGDPVLRGSHIASLRNDRLDTSALNDLRLQQTQVTKRLAEATRQRDQAQAEVARLTLALDEWRAERARLARDAMDVLISERDQARLTLSEAEAKVTALRQADPDAKALTEALVQAEQVRARLLFLTERVGASQDALNRLIAGEHDQDFEQHPQLTKQRAIQAAADSKVEAETTQSASVASAIQIETLRLDDLREARIGSEADGVVLRLQAGVGRWLNPDEVAAQIARPETVVVEAVLPDAGQDVAIGAKVLVHLIGQDLQVSGRIVEKIAPGASAGKERWAEDFTVRHRFRAVIRIQVDESPHSIQLNQGARVIIVGSTPSSMRQTLSGWYAAAKF